jgi:hypothetical protein
MDLTDIILSVIAVILTMDKLVTMFQNRQAAYRAWAYKKERERITIWNNFANRHAKEFKDYCKAKISKETHINYIMKDFYKAYRKKL